MFFCVFCFDSLISTWTVSGAPHYGAIKITRFIESETFEQRFTCRSNCIAQAPARRPWSRECQFVCSVPNEKWTSEIPIQNRKCICWAKVYFCAVAMERRNIDDSDVAGAAHIQWFNRNYLVRTSSRSNYEQTMYWLNWWKTYNKMLFSTENTPRTT